VNITGWKKLIKMIFKKDNKIKSKNIFDKLFEIILFCEIILGDYIACEFIKYSNNKIQICIIAIVASAVTVFYALGNLFIYLVRKYKLYKRVLIWTS
jgi:hypothetical protein